MGETGKAFSITRLAPSPCLGSCTKLAPVTGFSNPLDAFAVDRSTMFCITSSMSRIGHGQSRTRHEDVNNSERLDTTFPVRTALARPR